MTYYALISLFPLVLFIVSVLAFFVSTDDQQRLINELMQTLPLSEQDGRSELQALFDSVVSGRGALGLVGLVGTAYTASALFSSVRVALNGVFHVDQQRPFVIGKAIDLGLVLGFGILLLASFALTFLITFAQRQADSIVGDDLATLVAWLANLGYLLVPPLVTGLVFTLLYTTVARVGYTPRQVLPGVVTAALLFEALKISFAQYVASFGNYDATYGTLGFVVVLLLFFYLSAQVMLVGAEVARANVEVLAIEQRGRPMETVLNVRRSVAGFLERAHRWPVVGHLIPRDRAGELIEVIDPFEEETAEAAPVPEPPVPTPLAAPVTPVSPGGDGVPSPASVPRSLAAGGGGAGRWLALTALGVLVAGWLAGRER